MTSQNTTLPAHLTPTDLLGAKPAPRILMVGAGAVGQTYGYHLSRGGADVTFFVKEKYRAEAEAGFLMHQHRPLRGPRSFYMTIIASCRTSKRSPKTGGTRCG